MYLQHHASKQLEDGDKSRNVSSMLFCSLCLSFATIVLDISNYVIGIVSIDSVYHNISFVITGSSDFIAQSIRGLVRIVNQSSYRYCIHLILKILPLLDCLGQSPCRDPGSRILRSVNLSSFTS